MKVVEPHVIIKVTEAPSATLTRLEDAARTAYKSNLDNYSDYTVLKHCIASGHESVLEHSSVTVRFVVDRGISHELVRHRLAAFTQESTRYCNYSKDKFENQISVVKPCFFEEGTDIYDKWYGACALAEESYFALLANGATPQEARTVLPNSLKTELVMTANLREWRHVCKLRCAPDAHPQMRQVMIPVLNELKRMYPEVFGDLPNYFWSAKVR